MLTSFLLVENIKIQEVLKTYVEVWNTIVNTKDGH